MYKNRTNPKILCLNYHVKPNLPVLEFLQYMTIRSTKTGPTGNFYGLIGMSIQIHLHRFFSIGPTVTKIQTNVLTKSQQQLSLVILGVRTQIVISNLVLRERRCQIKFYYLMDILSIDMAIQYSKVSFQKIKWHHPLGPQNFKRSKILCVYC